MLSPHDTNSYSDDRAIDGVGELAGRVLVVDDSLQVLEVVKEILALHGFQVETAETGVKALTSIGAKTPDLIICDVMMPEMDGYQVYSQVAANPVWSHIPFLFLTALSAPASVRQAKAMGCDDYLIKPFDPKDLIAVVKGKMRSAKMRSASLETHFELHRKRIIQTLSHEFRTPLVAVNTGTELLLDQIDNLDKGNIRKLLESIQRGGRRLRRLVEDFIVLQQIDSGKAEDSCDRYKSVVNVGVLCKRLTEFWSQIHPDRTICYFEPQYQVSSVRLYEVQIVDAVGRIIENALKFSPAESVVELSVEQGHDYVSIVVRDYGIGLSEEVWDDACMVFEQIDRPRKEQQGCGLGLSIASAYVAMNGGSLYFRQPEAGDGLVVEIKLRLSESNLDQ